MPDLADIRVIKMMETQGLYNRMRPYVHDIDKADAESALYLKSGNYYEWYYAAARAVNPAVILELGVRFGYSGMAMLAGAQSPVYIGFDNECGEERSNDYARANLAHFIASAIYVSALDTQHCQELPYPDRGPAQLIHVDAKHTAEGVYHDLDLALPHWDESGLILVDDVLADRALLGASAIWAQQNGMCYMIFETYKGLMVIYRSEAWTNSLSPL